MPSEQDKQGKRLREYLDTRFDATPHITHSEQDSLIDKPCDECEHPDHCRTDGCWYRVADHGTPQYDCPFPPPPAEARDALIAKAKALASTRLLDMNEGNTRGIVNLMVDFHLAENAHASDARKADQCDLIADIKAENERLFETGSKMTRLHAALRSQLQFTQKHLEELAEEIDPKQKNFVLLEIANITGILDIDRKLIAQVMPEEETTK